MGSIGLIKFKFFIFDLISFGTPQAIVIDISLIFLILILVPTGDLGYMPIKSLYSNFIIPTFFNNTCPSEGIFTNCGFYSMGQTRGLSRLLHGDFRGAWNYNKLVFILFVVMLFVLLVNLAKVYKIYKRTGRIFNY